MHEAEGEDNKDIYISLVTSASPSAMLHPPPSMPSE